jgi:hypothetical protein
MTQVTVTFLGGPGHLRQRDVTLQMGRVLWYPGGIAAQNEKPPVLYHARQVRPGVWFASPAEWLAEDFAEAVRRYEGGFWS